MTEVLMEYKTKSRIYKVLRVPANKKKTGNPEVDLVVWSKSKETKVIRLAYDDYGTVIALDDKGIGKVPLELLDGLYTLFMNTSL